MPTDGSEQAQPLRSAGTVRFLHRRAHETTKTLVSNSPFPGFRLFETKLKPIVIKKSPSFFDAKGLKVTQHFCDSVDGTQVPYFQISRTNMKLDGSNPTLLYAYGGFEISMLPYYSATRGVGWFEDGGVWIVANIRGGGEYSDWHQSALLENRYKAYEDFESVACACLRAVSASVCVCVERA